MDIPTIVNIVLCIFSFILAVISVVTVMLTLKQNAIMIENATRAYITISGDIMHYKQSSFYLVVKNFGQSNAQIKSLQCNVDLSAFSYDSKLTPFSHLENISIAPGQTLRSRLVRQSLVDSGIDLIHFDITYTSNNKTYSESFDIRIPSFAELICARDSSPGNELDMISCVLQELNERLL